MYRPGDVVLVPFPYTDQTGKEVVKKRPAVVYSVEGIDENIVLKITSKNKSHIEPGIWVMKDSKEGKQMGLLQDSYICAKTELLLKHSYILRKIGRCPFMEDLDDLRAA